MLRKKNKTKTAFKARNLTDFSHKKAYMTYGLVLINCLVFYIEINVGGSENLEVLYALGGLVSSQVWHGEWWRLLSANFLHYGWFHLTTNMLGLYFFGRFVELSIGSSRYLIVYLVSGVGAMFIFSLISLEIGEQEEILVGASAAIMGLIGCISAISLNTWRRYRSRISAQRLQLIVFIIGIQFIFDFITPQVSTLSHFLGLVIGFLTGFIWSI